jgi:hypothetical protein
MVGITTTLTFSMAYTVSRFEPHRTLMGTSQMALEQMYDTSKRYPRIVGACVFSVSQVQGTQLHGAS